MRINLQPIASLDSELHGRNQRVSAWTKCPVSGNYRDATLRPDPLREYAPISAPGPSAARMAERGIPKNRLCRVKYAVVLVLMCALTSGLSD